MTRHATDLERALALGVERAGELLTAGEAVVLRGMVGLTDEAARWWARLVDRVHEAYPIDGIPGEVVAELEAVELVDRLVPWSVRAARSTRARLAYGCRQQGLPVGGSRVALLERLAGRRGWDARTWLRIRHRGLVHRLRQWAALDAWPDPRRAVVARLGHLVWPAYSLTSGPGLWPRRASMLAWEGLLSGAVSVEALRAGTTVAPGRLDLTRHVVGALFDAARALERSHRTAEARALYLALRPWTADVLVRIARTHEREGEAAAALDLLLADRPDPLAEPSASLEVAIAGRRLARGLRRGWAPDPPLLPAFTRNLPLELGDPVGARPGWRVGDRHLLVEPAVVAVLALAGRRAIHAEGSAWSTLFALLFAEAYFLPVPGALPVPHLDGPLDLGTPAFAARRTAVIGEVLAGVRAGEAGSRVAAADTRWRGMCLRGAAWGLFEPADLVAFAAGLPPAGLAAVLEALLRYGWKATRGLPDLVVLPGLETRLSGAFPSSLPGGVVLAEVKGPGDTLRPDQRIWADRLVRAGIRTEWWTVARR